MLFFAPDCIIILLRGAMSILFVINQLSGNSDKVNPQALVRAFPEDKADFFYIRKPSDTWSPHGYDKIAVCGGDGTLSQALNLCRGLPVTLYYVPCGTFNETAKTHKKGAPMTPKTFIGNIGGRCFSYVAAAGSFTSIGYSVSASAKRKFKIFAYLAKVVGAYKVHNIPATLRVGDKTYSDSFTLIMFIDSSRCFGFNFNRIYKDTSDLYLLTVKSPGKNSLLNKIKIFFPFFRAFFIGFSKPYDSRNMHFCKISEAELVLSSPRDFCLDGDKVVLDGSLKISKQPSDVRLYIVKKLK